MNDQSLLIESIPIRHNITSSLILSGILIAFLAVVVIFLRSDKQNHTIRLFGALLLVEVIIGVDGFLCYTGLIKYVIHLNDASEPLSLLIGPLVYLFIKNAIDKKAFSLRWDVIHMLPAALYTVSQIPYYAQTIGIKYNAYINAYHSHLEYYESDYSQLFLLSDSIKSGLRWYIVLSFVIYIFLSLRVYFSSRARKNLDTRIKIDRVSFSKSVLFFIIIVLLVILIIYTNFESDLGDHYITLVFTICNFIAVGFIMSESRLFDKSWISDKYQTSGLKSTSDVMFQKINSYVKENGYYLNSNTSLTDLAGKLSIPNNYISQAINEEDGVNFSDYINSFRVTEAKARLSSEAYKHYNIESIGESVGFNAKSTFYAAFKKHTGMTPSAYLKSL